MALQITSTIDSDSGRTNVAYVRIAALGYSRNTSVVEIIMDVFLNQASTNDKIISKAIKTSFQINNVTIAQFETNFTIAKIYALVKQQYISSGLTVIDV